MIITFGGGRQSGGGYQSVGDVSGQELKIWAGAEIDAIQIGDLPKLGGSGVPGQQPIPIPLPDGSIILQAMGFWQFKLVYIKLLVGTESREFGDYDHFLRADDVSRLIVDNFKVTFNGFTYTDNGNIAGRITAIEFNFDPNKQNQ